MIFLKWQGLAQHHQLGSTFHAAESVMKPTIFFLLNFISTLSCHFSVENLLCTILTKLSDTSHDEILLTIHNTVCYNKVCRHCINCKKHVALEIFTLFSHHAK